MDCDHAVWPVRSQRRSASVYARWSSSVSDLERAVPDAAKAGKTRSSLIMTLFILQGPAQVREIAGGRPLLPRSGLYASVGFLVSNINHLVLPLNHLVNRWRDRLKYLVLGTFLLRGRATGS